MKLLCAAFTLAVAATPALAGPVLLDFEGPTSFASINTFYDGGTDGAGVTGPRLGVVFGPDALGLKNDDVGTYFSNAPSPLGVMTPVGGDATLTSSVSFRNLSLYYAALQAVTNGVQVWSGTNGTGTLLGALDLAANATDNCNDSPVCNFTLATIRLAGEARSITFGNSANLAAFDNVRFEVPAPGAALLLPLALAGLMLARRRA